MSFLDALGKVAGGQALSGEEMRQAFTILLDGGAAPEQIAAFLTALRVRGETSQELRAAVDVLKARARMIEAPDGTVDTCGTGGDSADTYNISTAVALVLAGGGVPVAKHGNRAVSSLSGSSDVLSALGVSVDLALEEVERGLSEDGIAFLFAPNHHPVLANVAPIRKALGFRTLFNMLGPLLNPAGAGRQLVGVFAPELLPLFADVTREGGSEHVWVVHGTGGLDELSLEGESLVCEVRNKTVREFVVVPEDAGLERIPNDDLRGGSIDENAKALRALLDGKAGPYREAVLFNAAAGFIVAGKADDLKAGASLARESIDSGAARSRLDALVNRGGRA